MTTLRDPRINPKPGDRVRVKNRTRLVTRVDKDGIYYKIEEQANAHEKNCWTTTWWDWCKKHNAEILEVSES